MVYPRKKKAGKQVNKLQIQILFYLERGEWSSDHLRFMNSIEMYMLAHLQLIL